MTNCNRKISQYPEYTGATPNYLIFPVVDTSIYANYNITYDDLVSALQNDFSGNSVSNFYLSGNTTLVGEKTGGDKIYVNLLPLLNYEHYLSAGTYSNGFIYFSGYNGNQFSVDVRSLLDDTNTYTTGGTMSGNTIVLTRNDGVNIYGYILILTALFLNCPNNS